MRYLVCLLLSLAAGFGSYAVGAVAWSALDPEGAGAKLLFTIPVALAGMTAAGILGMLCFVFRGEFVPEPRAAQNFVRNPTVQPAPAPARPRPATVAATRMDEELELVLAT